MSMFLSKKEKTTTKIISGIGIIFKNPTISDEIQIEAKKQVLTRGQYASLGFSPMQSSADSLDYTDMISTLSVVATKDDQTPFPWEELANDEGKAFLKECYVAFVDWRSSFRKGAGKDATGEPPADSNE